MKKNQAELWTEERSRALPKAKKPQKTAAAKRREARANVPLARSPFAMAPGAEPLKLSVAQSLAYYGVVGIHVVEVGGRLQFDGPLSDPEAGRIWLEENATEIRSILG